jgi:hypothetical protein
VEPEPWDLIDYMLLFTIGLLSGAFFGAGLLGH